MIIELRNNKVDKYIRTEVFMGKDMDHLRLSGTLVMDIGEWQIFSTSLLFGTPWDKKDNQKIAKFELEKEKRKEVKEKKLKQIFE